MKFVLNMAWRETRASWRRLLLFFLCIAIGVGSIVGLRSLVQNMKVAVNQESRSFFYAADVRVGTNGAWKPETRTVLESYSNSPLVTAHTEAIVTTTMARPAIDQGERPVMVQVRGLQEQFPLYGEIQLSGGARYTHALLNERGVLTTPGLLRQLNLEVGDELKIGQSTFTIRGVIERMPGNAMDFSPIPRVVMDYADVESTGVIGFASRVSYLWLFKTPEGQDEALGKEFEREFNATPRIEWGSFRGQETFMTRLLTNWENFLGLVGLAVLVLGGIGISSVTRVFVQQKLKTIAILKCLGGRNRRVLGAYLTQVLALSLIGSLLGLLLAVVITFMVSRYAAGRFPIHVVPGLTWQAALQGSGIGVLVTLLFSLPPLLEIRRVKPILALRSLVSSGRSSVGRGKDISVRSNDFSRFSPKANKSALTALTRIDWVRVGAELFILPGLLVLAAWQSGSLKNAGIFLGGMVGTALILNLTGLALIRSLRRVRHLPSFTLRQGVSSLYRPGNQTRVILFTVGLGALFMISIRIQQVNVLSEYRLDLESVAADLFLIDIQKDQSAAVEEAVTRLGGTDLKLIPVVPARVVGLKYDPSNVNRATDEEIRRRLGGERLSYRNNLEGNEEIVAGKFWEATPGAEPEISIEEGYSRGLGLGIGDKLVLDLSGQNVEATVTSIRRIERRVSPVASFTRFRIIFRPGTLDPPRQMILGAVKGPPPGAERTELQRKLVDQFLNLTVIDAFDTIAEVRKNLREISFAVSFLGGFVLLCGVLILTGSIAMTKFQRLYEAAILKTLGAKKKLIVYITLVEYGVLGLLAGVIGSAAAIGLTWAVSKYSLRVPWHVAPSVNLLGTAATLLLVTMVGVLSSWDVMTKKPLGILRAE